MSNQSARWRLQKSKRGSASPHAAIEPERWLLEISAPVSKDLCEEKTTTKPIAKIKSIQIRTW
jgi:hypothetical protein